MRCCDGLHRVTSRPVGGSWQFPLPRPNGAHATRVPCWGSVLQSLDNSASRLHRRVCLACHIAALTYRPRFGVSRIHLLAAKNAPHPAQSSQLGCEMADPLRDAVCCLLVSDDTLVNPLKMRGKIRALSIIVWRELERTANLAVSPSGFSHVPFPEQRHLTLAHPSRGRVPTIPSRHAEGHALDPAQPNRDHPEQRDYPCTLQRLQRTHHRSCSLACVHVERLGSRVRHM